MNTARIIAPPCWPLFRLSALLVRAAMMQKARYWQRLGHPGDVATCTFLADSVFIAMKEGLL